VRALLDVNVLIALLDSAHLHHRQATNWLEQHIGRGWASCPITQNGCVRIMSHPGYPNRTSAQTVAGRLASACALDAHEFWADDVSVLKPGALDWQRLVAGRHLTDAYLLTLAVRHRGCFVTLDRNIPVAAVPGADERHLVVIE
jgi:uncharacterized protein